MSFLSKSLVFVSIATSGIYALPAATAQQASASNCGHRIDGVGIFMRSATYTFTGNTLPTGLRASDNQLIHDQTNGAPYNHVFQATNVAVAGGYLQIKVPGGQTPAVASNQAITAGEVYTAESDILYASVRTKAILSIEPGTTQGTFFYKSDTQEIDIEYLSDPNSKANVGGKADIHYTNQPTNGGSSKTAKEAASADTGTAVHEYRIDWTSGFTAFYLDGVLHQKYTVNVPSQPGTWLWNNWANGDPQWSVGPPAKDGVMKIKSIEMYYNTSSNAAGC